MNKDVYKTCSIRNEESDKPTYIKVDLKFLLIRRIYHQKKNTLVFLICIVLIKYSLF